MQNSLKMRSRMSSVVVSPMISPSALTAARRSTATNSAAMQRSTESSTCSSEACARSSAPRCRKWVISTPSLGSSPCLSTALRIASRNSSRPAPAVAEVQTMRFSSVSPLRCNASRRGGRSDLLTTRIAAFPRARSRSRRSSSPSGSLPSSTARTSSARASASCERRTPSRSTTSTVSRRPAVSSRRTGMPRTLTNSSSTSRVVPGIGVTIARSAFASAFMRLDLPTLGRPTSTAVTPSRTMRPSSAVRMSCAIRSRTTVTPFARPCAEMNVMSSSEKSIPASTSTSRRTRPSRRRPSSSDRAPRSCSSATRRPASVRAEIRSMTASACARSSRPFRKARFENSPGSASRAPLRRRASIPSRRMSGPPWQWNSTMSSQV